MAVAAASFAISIDSISLGLMLAKALPAALVELKSPVGLGIPSIIISGYELSEIELVPLIRKTEDHLIRHWGRWRLPLAAISG